MSRYVEAALYGAVSLILIVSGLLVLLRAPRPYQGRHR